jgi:hypothetical protein
MKTPFGDIRVVPGEEICFNAEDICKAVGFDNGKLRQFVSNGTKIEIMYDAELKDFLFTKRGVLSVIKNAKNEFYNDEEKFLKLSKFEVYIKNNY